MFCGTDNINNKIVSTPNSFHFISLIKCSRTFILEPDVGMAEKDAHKFFKQLIAAVVSEVNMCVDLHQYLFLLLLNYRLKSCRSTFTVLASPTET